MLLSSPLSRGLAARPLLARACSRTSTVRADLIEDIKYGLSNADEESRPARDLVESPVALAYLVVLAALAGGLAWLALQDQRNARKREASFLEQERAAAMLRSQGLDSEAAALEKDLVVARAPPPKQAEPKPRGLGASDPYDTDGGNRYERRQGRAAKREKREKAKKRRKK